MRSFALVILLWGILIANLGITSPLPDSADLPQGFGLTHTKHDIKNRHAAPENFAVGNAAEADVFVKKFELRATAPPESLVDEADLHLSASLHDLFARQLVDPTFTDMNKPCAQAIIAKYGQVDFNNLPLTEKTMLLNAINDCIYGLSAGTYGISAEEAIGTNVASKRADQRCPKELIENAFLRTNWYWLNEPNKTPWWIILASCLKQESGSSIKQLHQPDRQAGTLDPAKEQKCWEKVVNGWTGDLSISSDQAALMLAIMDCGSQSQTTLMVRDVGEGDLVKEEECMKTVAQTWTGDLSTKEDQDAFMLAVIRCINESHSSTI